MLPPLSQAKSRFYNVFRHVMHNLSGIDNPDAKLALSEIHQMTKIYQHFLFLSLFFLSKIQNPFRTIIPTGRCVKHSVFLMGNQKKCFNPTGKLNRRDCTQNRALDQVFTDNI